MSHIIDFLESAGQNARFRYASQNEVEQALTRAEIAPALRMAILAKDQVQLEKLLGQVPLCAPLAPGNDDQGEDDDDTETPSRETDETSSISIF